MAKHKFGYAVLQQLLKCVRYKSDAEKVDFTKLKFIDKNPSVKADINGVLSCFSGKFGRKKRHLGSGIYPDSLC